MGTFLIECINALNQECPHNDERPGFNLNLSPRQSGPLTIVGELQNADHTSSSWT